MSSALDVDLESPDALGALWGNRVGTFTTEEWTEFFTVKQKLGVAKQELLHFEYQKYEEAENKNEVASNDIVRKIYETITVLIDGGAEAPRGWSELKELIEKQAYGDESFEAAETILNPYHYSKLLRGRGLDGIYALVEVKELYSEWKGVETLH